MGLKSFSAGDNILVSATKAVRNLRDAGETYYNVTETIEDEEREWVALTKAAAEGAKTALSGEASMTLSGAGVVYEHSVAEQNRIVGAYTYRCSAQKKTVEFA